MDTANQACRRVFPLFNTYAFGRLPCSWSHFARKQMATEIHLFGLINTKIWFSTCTEIRDLFANGSRKRFLHKNRGSNNRWSGRSHLPGAVFVLRHFCAGGQATLELSGRPGGSDERRVTCEPATWCLASSAHTSARGPAGAGSGRRAEKHLRKKETLNSTRQAVIP